MRVGIIPARGGSKRIPRKNLKEFFGKPIIAWSIDTAIKSKCFDRIIVSTDDIDIANVAKKYGAEAPFIRPEDLANDHAGVTEVVTHAIKWLKQNVGVPSEVCCILATAPFLKPVDIKKGLEKLSAESYDFVFTATRYAFPIQRAIRITNTGRVEMFQPQYFKTRSQDLEESFHDAGQFYWGKTNAWLSDTPIFKSNSAALILPRDRVQDIDTIEDWTRAELMFEIIKKQDQNRRG